MLLSFLKRDCSGLVFDICQLFLFNGDSKVLFDLQIVTRGKDFGWGALLQYHKKPNPLEPLSSEMLFILDVAMCFSPESVKDVTNVSQLRPPKPGENGVVEVFLFLLLFSSDRKFDFYLF